MGGAFFVLNTGIHRKGVTQAQEPWPSYLFSIRYLTRCGVKSLPNFHHHRFVIGPVAAPRHCERLSRSNPLFRGGCLVGCSQADGKIFVLQSVEANYFSISAITDSISSFTPNNNVDLRLLSQFIPTKYKPGYCVTPRCVIGNPSSSVTGSLTRL